MLSSPAIRPYFSGWSGDGKSYYNTNSIIFSCFNRSPEEDFVMYRLQVGYPGTALLFGCIVGISYVRFG